MPGVIEYLCEHGASIQGYIAPGHVAAVTGSKLFAPLAEKYGIPFAVSGFEGEEILEALCELVETVGAKSKCEKTFGLKIDANVDAQISGSESKKLVRNCYPSVVSEEGNLKAQLPSPFGSMSCLMTAPRFSSDRCRMARHGNRPRDRYGASPRICKI